MHTHTHALTHTHTALTAYEVFGEREKYETGVKVGKRCPNVFLLLSYGPSPHALHLDMSAGI